MSMNVVYASDDKYAPIMAVSILSLLKYNSDITIYILDNGIQSQKKAIIKLLVEQHQQKIVFCDISLIDKSFNYRLNTDRGSIAQFARLFLSNSIPISCERLLYLDCDILICDSLNFLFEFDLQGYLLAGVEDAFSVFHRKCLGLKKNDIYINSGVLLIDMKLWRNESVEEKFLNYLNKKRGNVLQGDQGLISAVLSKRIKLLSLEWNVVSYIFDFSYEEIIMYRNPSRYYSKEAVINAKNCPRLVHFTNSFASMRPWEGNQNLSNPYADRWRKLSKKINISTEKKDDKLSYQIYQFLPHKFVLVFIRIVHSFVKPLLYSIKCKYKLLLGGMPYAKQNQ